MRKYQALQGMSSTNSIDEQFFFVWSEIALKRITREMHWEWNAMYNVLRKKQVENHGNSRFNYLLQITRFCNWIDTPSEYNFRLTTWKWIFQWAFGWVQCNLKSHVLQFIVASWRKSEAKKGSNKDDVELKNQIQSLRIESNGWGWKRKEWWQVVRYYKQNVFICTHIDWVCEVRHREWSPGFQAMKPDLM